MSVDFSAPTQSRLVREAASAMASARGRWFGGASEEENIGASVAGVAGCLSAFFLPNIDPLRSPIAHGGPRVARGAHRRAQR